VKAKWHVSGLVALLLVFSPPEPGTAAAVSSGTTSQEAGRIMARALTIGEKEFKQANALLSRGQTNEAVEALVQLRRNYPATWIDRRAGERLTTKRSAARAV